MKYSEDIFFKAFWAGTTSLKDIHDTVTKCFDLQMKQTEHMKINAKTVSQNQENNEIANKLYKLLPAKTADFVNIQLRVCDKKKRCKMEFI